MISLINIYKYTQYAYETLKDQWRLSPERGSARNLWRVFFFSKKQVYTDSAPFLKGRHIYSKAILFLNVNHNLITN